MPVFEYKGMNRVGKSIRGTVDADNSRNARARLKKDGIFVTEIRNQSSETDKKSKGKISAAASGRVNVQEMSMMTRQLASLVRANIPLVECLTAVADQVENQALKASLSQIRDSVNEGGQLFKALARYPKIYSKIYCTMVEAGEQSGTLDVILVRLAEFTEAQNELNTKVKSAMFYPLIMLIFTLAMLMGLFVFVIPKVTSIFDQSELKLPWYSQVVIDFSGILVNYWHLLIGGIFLVGFLFRNWKNTPNGAAQWDAILLKLPLIGKLVRMIAVSRFTRTLSTLLAGGVPMLMAMDIVRNVVDNAVLEKAIAQARDNISEGESIAQPLKKSGQFPPIVIHMIGIGEKTGELEGMLTQVSDSYDFQVKTAVSGLTAVLEPIMIVIMGMMIAVIVFAILVPIFQMSNLAG